MAAWIAVDPYNHLYLWQLILSTPNMMLQGQLVVSSDMPFTVPLVWLCPVVCVLTVLALSVRRTSVQQCL